MASTIPGTKFAQGVPPATTGQVTWQAPRQGDGGIPAGLDKMGKELFSYALNVERKKMVAEVSRNKRMIDEKGWLARESVIGDDEADGKLWERYNAEVNEIIGSSEYVDVNETMGQYANSVLPYWKHGIDMQSKSIQSANADTQIEYEAQRFLELGDIKNFNDTINKAIKLSPHKRAFYENLKAEAPTQSILAMAERKMLEGDGKGAQADLVKFKDEDATTKQLDQKNVLEYNIKKLNEGKENGIELQAYQFAIDGDWQGGLDLLSAKKQELGGDWYIDTMNKYRNAFSILNKTGVNVYKTTQSPVKFGEIRDKVIAGTSSEAEIRANVGAGGYSTADEAYLLRLFNGDESKAKALEDSAAGKNLTAQIDAIIDKGTDADPEEVALNQYATQKGLALLQDAIANNPNMSDREKKEESLRIGRNLQREYQEGVLEAGLEKLFQEPFKPAKAQPEGTPAGTIKGKNWGVYNKEGNVVLTEHGVKLILDKFKGNVKKGMAFAKKRNYIIPE